MTGILYVVSTPIGNLNDLSPRAKITLENVALIVAEDTRHSGYMLNQFGIKTKIISYHEHNEYKQSAPIIKALQAGTSVALISDAGTPLIADPGCHLLRAAHAAQIKVIPVPGPSALISALSVAGFPANQFIFEGYLPNKTAARRRHLELLRDEPRTLVFYEAPHRILSSINDLISCFGTLRQAVIAKEISKLYENIKPGTLTDLLTWLRSDEKLIKGEFVIVVQGYQTDNTLEQFDLQEARRILKILLAEHSVKVAAHLASKIMQGNKNQIYKLAIELANT